MEEGKERGELVENIPFNRDISGLAFPESFQTILPSGGSIGERHFAEGKGELWERGGGRRRMEGEEVMEVEVNSIRGARTLLCLRRQFPQDFQILLIYSTAHRTMLSG